MITTGFQGIARFAVFTVCLSFCASAQQAQSLFERAKQALAADAPETASRLLREAHRAAHSIVDAKVRTALLVLIDGLAKRADPQHEERSVAESKVARRLLRLAERYDKKSWAATGAELRALVAQLDPDAVAATLRSTTEDGSGDPTQDFFADASNPWRTGDWTFRDGVWASPAIAERKSTLWIAPAEVPDRCRLSVQCRFAKGVGKAALAFAARDNGQENDFHALELEATSKFKKIALWHIRGTKSHSIHSLVMPGYELRPWTELTVELRGGVVCWRFDTGPWYYVRGGHSDLTGRVGMFVSWNPYSRQPVRFRRFSLVSLDDSQPEESTPNSQGVATRLKLARQAALDARPEDAVEMLVGLLRDAVTKPKAERRRIEVEAKRLLRKTDALWASRMREFKSCVHELRKLAAIYAKRGWRHTVVDLLSLADEMRHDLVAAELAAARSALRTEASGSVTPSVDALPECFAQREEIGLKGWRFEDAVLRSPKPARKSSRLVAKRQLPRTFTLSVDIDVGSPLASAGVVFGYRSKTDYWVFYVRHDRKSSAFQVVHWNGVRYERVTSSVLVDVWKPEDRLGWKPLRLQVDGGRLRVSYADFGERVVESGGRDFAGRIGFFLGAESAAKKPIAFRKLAIE